VFKVKIEETACIGCTKCIDVCPVDAIIGAQNQLHTVLEVYCIGCKLCLPPCPVQCISVFEVNEPKMAEVAKERIEARKTRLAKKEEIKKEADKIASLNIKASLAACLERSRA